MTHTTNSTPASQPTETTESEQREPDRGSSAPQPSNNWPLALSATAVGAFLSILDLTVVNVGLPSIQAQFGASGTDIQWISTAFSLALGVTIPASGWLGAKYGLKRTYLWSLVGFAIASALCGLAWNLPSLIFFRILQAVPGAIIPTLTLTLIQRIVPKEKLGVGMAVYGISSVMAPALGPVVGGYLVEYTNWRMLFFINLPFAFLAIFLGFVTLPRFPAMRTTKFDILGFSTVASGLFALLLALSKGPDWGWTGYRVLGLLALSVNLLALFVVVELVVDEPLLDPRIFRIWTFASAQVLVSILSSGYFAVLFYVPLFLQEGLHITPVNTGLVMLPEGITMAVAIAIGGGLYDKIGARRPGIIGFLITMFAASLMCHITPDASRAEVAWWTALRGFGYALAVVPIMTAGLAAIPAEKLDGASAFMNLVWRVSGALFVGILNSIAAVKQSQFMSDHEVLLYSADPNIAAIQNQGARGLISYYQQLQVAVQSQVIDNLFIVMLAITAGGLLLSLTLKSGRPTADRSESPTELAL